MYLIERKTFFSVCMQMPSRSVFVFFLFYVVVVLRVSDSRVLNSRLSKILFSVCFVRDFPLGRAVVSLQRGACKAALIYGGNVVSGGRTRACPNAPPPAQDTSTRIDALPAKTKKIDAWP